MTDEHPPLELELLGPLVVRRDGEPVDLGPLQRRALLALLAIHSGEVVSTDRLIDSLWGERGGPDKQNSIWVHVSNLRSALDPDRPKRSPGSVLLTRAPGYLLQLPDGAIDVRRFERLVHEGRVLLETDPAAAAIVLAESLRLWRGHALEEFAYEPWATATVSRLEELRLEALEARIQADLARGLGRALVAELDGLVRTHPLREGFTGQLMQSLYRAGRPSDALAAFRALERRLGEELGLEPSSSLRRLEEQIVLGEPGLEAPTSGVGDRRSGPAIRGYELRDAIVVSPTEAVHVGYQSSVGREVTVTVISPEVADDPAFIRTFEDRARSLANLDHPAVLDVVDFWREPGAAYVVTEPSAAQRLSDLAGTSVSALTRIGATVAGALAVIHDAGGVHGALGPHAILVDDDRIALTDFVWAPITTSSRDVVDLATCLLDRLDGVQTPAADALRSVLSSARNGELSAAELAQMLESTGPGQRPGAVPSNPYKGLRPFDAADAADFHGRSRLVDRLVAHVGRSGRQGRLLAVVGPSGSGKSSVVRAGLLPALADAALPSSDLWFHAVMTPGPHPFEALEAALNGISTASNRSLMSELVSGPEGLASAVDRALPEPGRELVLVIDQFEELFVQSDPSQVSPFLESLCAAVADSHSRLRLIVSLRADHLDGPLEHQTFGELLRDSTQIVTPMSADELEAAIARPAERRGVMVDPALIGAMVSDATGRTGSLPLLQFALTELFDRRPGAHLTLAQYEQVGGVSGALVERADGVVTGLDAAGRELVRQLLLQLVTSTDGEALSRRRVPLPELKRLEHGEQVEQIITTLVRHRLLSLDRDPRTRTPTVELAHEALLSDWPQLHDWIESSRADLVELRRLAGAAAVWNAADGTAADLLVGGRLERAEDFLEASSVAVPDTARSFVAASRAATDAVDRRRRRSRRLVLGGFACAALVAMAIAAIALAARNRAEDNAALARSRELSAAAIRTLDDDPELSLLLSIQAADGAEPPIAAVSALHEAIGSHRMVFRLDLPPDLPGEQLTGDLSDDGRLIVAPFTNGGWVQSWDVHAETLMWSTTLPVDPPDGSGENGILSTAWLFENDTKVAVTVVGWQAGAPNTYQGTFILDAFTGAMLDEWPEACLASPLGPRGDAFITSIDCEMGSFGIFDLSARTLTPIDFFTIVDPGGEGYLSTDGSRFVARRPDTITVWDVGLGEAIFTVPAVNAEYAISTDGALLTVTDSADSAQRTYQVDEGELLSVFAGHASDARGQGGEASFPAASWFSDDGSIAYAAGRDGVIHVWDPVSGVAIDRITTPGPLIGARMTTDNRLLAGFESGRTVTVFDRSLESVAEVAYDREGPGDGLLLSPAGDLRAELGPTTDAFRGLPIEVTFTAPDGQLLHTFGPTAGEPKESVAFRPDGERVAVAEPFRIDLLDTATWEVVSSVTIAEAALNDAVGLLRYTPDGEALIAAPGVTAGSSDVVLLNADDLTFRSSFDSGHAAAISGITLDDSGDRLATGDLAGLVRVWDLDSETLDHELRVPGPVSAIAFEGSDALRVTLADGDVLVQTLDVDELLAVARARLTRGFTEVECEAFVLDPCPGLDELRAG